MKRYAALCPDALVAVWLALWWGCNLLQAGFTELAHDEAYYHMFAENLAWGYFDHPPVTALLVRLGGMLFGGELGVRLLFTVLQPLYLYLFWRLIRPADADRRDASLYLVLAASTLMLQLYGFIAVPDGPLMMTAVLFLGAFNWFAEHRRWAWLWLGVAMAAMAYSKYHGALIVLFTLAVNPRQLLRPGFWGGCAVAALLFIPHLVWQYNHDWASFAYHLAGRNKAFSWSSVTDYLLNLVVVFNPLFFPLYIKAWFAAKPVTPLERALKMLPAAFILFFLATTLRGYVQPQWLIVGVYGLLWSLWSYARRHGRTRRYLMRAGMVTLALVALVRIEMVFNPLGIRFEIFNNRESFAEIARFADGRPVVFRSSYAVAAKYRYYTGAEAYCQPNITYRTHQWQFRDDDTQFAGRDVLIESLPDTTGRTQSVVLANGYRFNYFEDRHFTPVRRADVVMEGLSATVAPGDSLSLKLRIVNPYAHPIEVDAAEVSLDMVWRNGRAVTEFPTGLRFTLPAGGEVTCRYRFVVPDELAGKRYEAGFALRKRGYTYWFNGKALRTEVLER